MSLFLTLFIMSPAVESITKDSLNPYLSKEITLSQAVEKAVPPVKTFMLKQTRAKDIELFLSVAKKSRPQKIEDLPLSILVPAFSISELKTAFEIGFLIYLPFLIVDMVVASILLSMGMMMIPPVMISLPFKLLLFVMADGWNLVVGSVVRSFQ
jgi:flagellar biosynthetic protein FliP